VLAGQGKGLCPAQRTQTFTALALHALFTFEPVLESALVIGAMTVDAARGSDDPFDPRIHELRGHRARSTVASTTAHCWRQPDPALAPGGG